MGEMLKRMVTSGDEKEEDWLGNTEICMTVIKIFMLRSISSNF